MHGAEVSNNKISQLKDKSYDASDNGGVTTSVSCKKMYKLEPIVTSGL